MTSQAIWRRRAALMAAVGLLVAVPVTLLIRDGGEDETALPSQPATTTTLTRPETAPGVEDRGLGVSYEVPQGWKERKRASAIQLTSPDESAQVVVAAPAPAADADLLLEQTLEAFRSEYDEVDVAPGGGREIGGIEATGAVLRASRGEDELSILVAVAPGEQRAYLVEVFIVAGVAGERLREAQAALNSLEFEG